MYLSESVAHSYCSIDGVLLRSNEPIDGAHKTLSRLNKEKIPWVLLTNGGGKTEAARVAELSEKLNIDIGEDRFIQSHTPFRSLAPEYEGKTVLVVGGDDDKCRHVAEG